jgi:hypothetical protein
MQSERDRREAMDALHARAAVRVNELEQLPIGPGLAVGLLEVRGMTMDPATGVRATALWLRLSTWCEAESMLPLTESVNAAQLIPGAEKIGALKLVGEELAAMTHLPFGTMMDRVTLVDQIGRQLPLSWEALDRGDLTMAHVKQLSRAVIGCPARVTAIVDSELVPAAIGNGWTPHQLGRAAEKAVMMIDPDGAADRVAAGKEDADVRLYAEQHETASLVATGSAVPLRQMMDAIDDLAAQLQRDGDARAVGVRRLAAMESLILGAPASRPAPNVVVTMDLDTLLGLNDRPGELSGYGPISSETARQIATDANLRRLVTDPLTGIMIDLGRSTYRPSKPLERIINHRDRTCQFPGCSRRAIKCDKDHRIEWECGGRTATINLHSLCRRHHNLKTHKLWQVTLNPDGSQTWTSALGFRYTKRPPSYLLDDFEPPEEDHLPNPPDDELIGADPDPPKANDPLPEAPPISLEEYLTYSDDLERQAYAIANRNYDTWLRNNSQLDQSA